MQGTLKTVFSKCLEAYSKEKREKWLFDWSSQIIVAVDSTIWTSDVEQAIER